MTKTQIKNRIEKLKETHPDIIENVIDYINNNKERSYFFGDREDILYFDSLLSEVIGVSLIANVYNDGMDVIAIKNDIVILYDLEKSYDFNSPEIDDIVDILYSIEVDYQDRLANIKSFN